MIKFFRNIRHRLLSENKFSKYLLYAAGEIVLVVIGILLALQINNWNEENKKRELEKELLTDLLENLELNLDQINRQLRWDSLAINSADTILNIIDLNMEYSDDLSDNLDLHFHYSRRVPSPFMTSSAYTAIENKGFEIISSKELRKNIIKLFDNTYPSLILETENIDKHVLKPKTQNFLIDRFESPYQNNDYTYKPNDFKALMEDRLYKNILTFNRFIQEYFVMLRKECRNEIQSLITEVENELGQKALSDN